MHTMNSEYAQVIRIYGAIRGPKRQSAEKGNSCEYDLHHYRLYTITPKGVKILVDLLGFKEGMITASRLRRRAGNPQESCW